MGVQERMTALADQIRILTGTGDLLSLGEMAEQTAEANGELSQQAELIRQIQLELEGLSVTGSGMFSGRAAGEIPTVYRGNARSNMDLLMISDAFGELQEE